ncbi:metal-binding protein [Methylacidiphilum caldifontis]|uniref:DR2241 family protein n=1 Tax=Methylacidiphilum caldifontis TaxID=2795386 RepID=UPI001A8CC3E7|nr:DR2241 family protein [Methylacidiphilum caldifontis]QSR88247.1 metal-binding protein [Methylacidiphilum caldifontis]
MNVLEYWQRWLVENPPPIQVGELQVLEGYWICNRKDSFNDKLVPISSLLDLKLMLRIDSKGLYRPLKGKIGIIQGWKFGPLDTENLFCALEGIYPFALMHWIGYKEKTYVPVPFESTIKRQVGMYKIIARADDSLIDQVVQETCRMQCLRQNLWWIKQPLELAERSSIPLVCLEACPFFLEQCRIKVLQKRQSKMFS